MSSVEFSLSQQAKVFFREKKDQFQIYIRINQVYQPWKTHVKLLGNSSVTISRKQIRNKSNLHCCPQDPLNHQAD